jgi:hypothetical protein
MSDFTSKDNLDLFLIKKRKEWTGTIFRLLGYKGSWTAEMELVRNPFGFKDNLYKFPIKDIYPVFSKRDDSDPNLVLIFEHFEAYKMVSEVDTFEGFIPTLEYGHVHFEPTFRCNMFDLNKVHLLKGRVIFWSCYETYSPEGVRDLTRWANKVSQKHKFPCELRAYNKPFSIGFTPRNVKYFLNNGWVLTENGFWENSNSNRWPPEVIEPIKPHPNKGVKRPRKKKEDGTVSG